MLGQIVIVGALFMVCQTALVPKSGSCSSIKLKYGRTRYRQKGHFAKFACNTGYIIAGEKYSTCVNGTWDGPIPKCVRANCKPINPPVNGLIYPSHRGAVLNFFCKPGYDLRGTTTLYCDGHAWDTSLPSCIKTNTLPLLSCDFESHELCGWNHDVRHDFDWTRMNYKTPSGHLGTGPSYDHTLGEGKDGYYMYIESSSRHVNDTARLISPIYDKMNDNVCLEFFYHMHGASTGQLRVYLKRLSDPWLLYPENTIFWKIGNHGDRWLRSFIHMGPITEDFQIIFEGVRGSSFYSDIAIDDISIIPNCTIKEVTTERDEVSTVDYLPTQSCMNRCDNNVTGSVNIHLQTCGCDDSCTDNNTCCPDYIALCVVGVTEDTFTTTDTTFIPVETSLKTISKKTNKASSSSLLTSTTPKIIVQTTLVAITTKRTTSSTKTTNFTPKSSTTTSEKASSTTTSEKVSSTPQRFLNSTTMKPVKVFSIPTRPTSPSIKQPTVPSISTSTLKRLPNFTSVTPIKFKPTTQSPIDDIITVPVRPSNRDKEDDSNLKPVYKEKDDLASSSMQNQKIVKEEHTSNTTMIVVAVLSVSGILTIIIGAAIVRRYRYACDRSRLRGCRSESQSDVRFLTGDEVLDFHLAYSDH